MSFVMKDNNIRPARVSDLREVAERDTRIRQLERQCKVLSAEVDAQRQVVRAVQAVRGHGCAMCQLTLGPALTAYEAAKEQG